jgi:hypothetical protein
MREIFFFLKKKRKEKNGKDRYNFIPDSLFAV